MSLISKAIPRVGRDFALELQRRFPPYDVRPGFDRDELMQSVGEQRIIKWILHVSNNSTIRINDTAVIADGVELKPNDVVLIKDTIEERKPTLFEKFTSRFGL